MSITSQMDKLVDEICATSEFYALYIAGKRIEENEKTLKEVLFFERQVIEIEDEDLTIIERKRQIESLKSKNTLLFKNENVEKYLLAKSAFTNLRRRTICYINRRIDDNLEILGLD